MEIQPFGKKAHDFISRPIHADARINILEGSVRSGKTVCMIPKLLSLCADGPKGLGIITGVSKDTVFDNVLRDLFDLVGTKNYHYNRQTGDLELFNTEWKVIGAKDEGSEKYIRGKTVAKAYCDELSLMPERFFKQLLNRMSVAGAKLYATTNPDNPNHYLYREYITDPEKLASGMVRVIHFELDDNPSLTDEYKTFIRAAYSGVFYQRFILGLWVVAEGAIFKDSFDDDNLFDNETMPIGLLNGYVDRYIGIDYGTTNPMVFLDILDDGDTLWQINEYYWNSQEEGRQKTDSEYANDLEQFVNGSYISPVLDPSAASFDAELKTRGIISTDADNEVLDGIRVLSTMLKRKKYKVHKHNCPNTIREFQSYCWDAKKAINGVEEPIKQNDHTCDAARYVVKTKIPFWRLAIVQG